MNKKPLAVRFVENTAVPVCVGLFGIIIMSIATYKGDLEFSKWKLMYDAGMILGPFAVVAIVYDLTTRWQHNEERIRLSKKVDLIVKKNANTDVLFSEDRRKKILEVIESAERELLILGISPLIDFYNDIDTLYKHLINLTDVKILSLNVDSEFLKTRQAQTLDEFKESDFKLEIESHKKIVERLFKHEQSHKKFDSILLCKEYDLPPAEMVYIADGKKFISSWYPFAKGEEAPLLYVEDASIMDETQEMLKHYQNTFDKVWHHKKSKEIFRDDIVRIPS